MDMEYVIEGKNFVKKFKGFELNIEAFQIPKGFATALIGENGAGKTTLMNALAGIRLDHQGEITYFDEKKSIMDAQVREQIGYTPSNSFFLPSWSVKQVEEITAQLFGNFDKERFEQIVDGLGIPVKNANTVKKLSDGNVMKLMISTVLARDTKLLMMDEPASPLDPLMRDKLCDIYREYLNEGEGQRSILFSTHDIADMESVTDYILLMQNGKIIEKGFVEELKEKYVCVKGEASDYNHVKDKLIGGNHSKHGFEGLLLSEDLEKISGYDMQIETPNLSQICINLLKQNSVLYR